MTDVAVYHKKGEWGWVVRVGFFIIFAKSTSEFPRYQFLPASYLSVRLSSDKQKCLMIFHAQVRIGNKTGGGGNKINP